MTLLLGSTPVELWHDIIHEAEAACTITLKEELESYLVFLLMRYIDKPHIMQSIIAHEFMAGLQEKPKKQQYLFQDVGDKCLIFSGLFPHMADKKLVRISYYIDMGQAAYATISRKNSDLYGMLARQFVPLMDILQSIRRYSKEISDLLPLEAYELWNDSGSQRAFRTLKNMTQATPRKIF